MVVVALGAPGTPVVCWDHAEIQPRARTLVINKAARINFMATPQAYPRSVWLRIRVTTGIDLNQYVALTST